MGNYKPYNVYNDEIYCVNFSILRKFSVEIWNNLYEFINSNQYKLIVNELYEEENEDIDSDSNEDEFSKYNNMDSEDKEDKYFKVYFIKRCNSY